MCNMKLGAKKICLEFLHETKENHIFVTRHTLPDIGTSAGQTKMVSHTTAVEQTGPHRHAADRGRPSYWYQVRTGIKLLLSTWCLIPEGINMNINVYLVHRPRSGAGVSSLRLARPKVQRSPKALPALPPFTRSLLVGLSIAPSTRCSDMAVRRHFLRQGQQQQATTVTRNNGTTTKTAIAAVDLIQKSGVRAASSFAFCANAEGRSTIDMFPVAFGTLAGLYIESG